MIIKGSLNIKDSESEIGGSVAYIRILNAEKADVESKIIAETNILIPDGLKSSKNIPFEIEIGEIEFNRNCILFAHLDLNDDKKISLGDYITMQSYPLNREPFYFYNIELHRVK